MIKVKITDSPGHIRTMLSAKWTVLAKLILFFIVTLIIVIIGIVWAFNKSFYTFDSIKELSGFKYLSILVIGIDIWLISLLVKIMIAIIRIPKTFSEGIKDALAEITFTEDEMIYTYITLRENTERRYKYGGICSAVEYEGFFELETKNITLCVFNDDITEGSPDELRTLLTEKLGEKFKVKD